MILCIELDIPFRLLLSMRIIAISLGNVFEICTANQCYCQRLPTLKMNGNNFWRAREKKKPRCEFYSWATREKERARKKPNSLDEMNQKIFDIHSLNSVTSNKWLWLCTKLIWEFRYFIWWNTKNRCMKWMKNFLAVLRTSERKKNCVDFRVLKTYRVLMVLLLNVNFI